MVDIDPIIAFALEYNAETPIPVLSHSGSNQEAILMLKYAKKHGIPVFERPELAKALLRLPEGSEIPDCLYKAVALLLIAIESY